MDKMNIGIMRNGAKPSYLVELIAIYSKAYDVNIIYMSPKDINIAKGTVSGKTLVNGDWIKIQTKIPKFIDISQFCFKKKNREIIEYLRNNVLLSDNGLNRNNKLKFIKEVKKDKKLNHLVIPTQKVNSIGDIITFMDKYQEAILKPIAGQFGRDIFLLKKDREKGYKLHQGTEERYLTRDDLYTLFEENLSTKKYIIQKFIHSITKQGYPFDCRINVEKNGKGEWSTARMFIRIGIGQKVVSNISQGGAVSKLKSFLNANFPVEQVKVIEQRLKEIAKTVPLKVEELRKQQLMTLGIDVGIDRDGSVYLFEVNGAPGTSQLRAEVAELRAQYYSFIKNKIQFEQKGVK